MQRFMKYLHDLWRSDGVTFTILISLSMAAYRYVPATHEMFISGFIGLVLGFVYPHACRGLGFIPYCYILACAVSLCPAWLGYSQLYVSLATASLGFAYQRIAAFLLQDSETRAYGRLLIGFAAFWFVFVNVATIAPVNLAFERIKWFSLIIGLLAIFAWLRLFRPAVELACEPVLRFMYRIRAVGPGIAAMPPRGPCLVVANHACWFDPFFLALILPRPVTPMMTSAFFDFPVIRTLLTSVVPTIRVPESHYKKQETPDEIHAAIAALDRGECVIMFPEGSLRRTEDKPLKRFGRGVWQILAVRPQTPVYSCWIEGGWGSYCSYFNGTPTKNKRLDVRRAIRIVVPEPILLDESTLTHHLTTRLFLMNRVLKARKLLNLPELPPFVLPKEDEPEAV
jgi:1-acyl-sn-glycerol-3-phosphate acyltransferase